MKAVLLFLAAFSCVCSAGQLTIEIVRSVTAQEAQEDARRQSYEGLRAWHDALDFFAAGLPKEYRFDLNGDRQPEVFVLYSGHSYWGGYSVFTRRNSKWIYIGDVSYGGHQPVRLPTKRGSWHDFSIDTDSSRDRLDRTFYRWDRAANSYVEHSRKEIRPMFPVEP